MLLLHGSSETGLYRHISNYVLGVHNFENKKPMKVIFFFLKRSEFQLDFKKAAKNSEKVFFSEIITSELVFLNCFY